MPRNVEDIETALVNLRASQRAKVTARDRRERDMLTALRDVESYDRQIDYDAGLLDGLLDELSQGIDARTLAALGNA